MISYQQHVAVTIHISINGPVQDKDKGIVHIVDVSYDGHEANIMFPVEDTDIALYEIFLYLPSWISRLKT